MSAAILACGAVSALGVGSAAVSAGTVGEPAHVAIRPDDELRAAGLAKPFVARAVAADPGDAGAAASPFAFDAAAVLLDRALRDCLRDLERVLPAFRTRRIGLAIGTSSGGMRSAETLFASIERGAPLDALAVERALYSGPLLEVARAHAEALGLTFAPATLVLAACASSTVAIGLATRWLAEDACDVVLAGGYDAVSVFVASGFEVLHATSASIPPRPFRVGRDGMALGEGAAILALVRTNDVPDAARPLAFVAGFGASADAVHLTAPDRTGGGLGRAAAAAIADAGVHAIDLVSAHATGTPFNDPAETRAMERALFAGDPGGVGEGAALDPVVHPFKAQIGHTLGAAGALEALACVDAMTRGVLPAAAGEGALDPEATVRLLATTERAPPGKPAVALKLSSAFGGANAALVLTRSEPPRRPPSARAAYDAYVSRAARTDGAPRLQDLAEATGQAVDRLARADALVLHALGALAALARDLGSLAGAGVVVGSALATLETNARFAARIRERGARMAEPRRFPYTSPNAVAGECGVAFGLTGPAFTVGAGLHAGLEALAAATFLVRAGDAERIVVVAVEQVEEVGARCASIAGFPRLESGAVAVMVSRSPVSAVARVGAIHLPLPSHAGDPGCATQAPLLALVGSRGERPTHLTVHAGPVEHAVAAAHRASIALEWLPDLT